MAGMFCGVVTITTLLLMTYGTLNETPGLVGLPIGRPKESIVEYYHDWLDKDGFSFWSMRENVKSWWAIKDLPNVMFVHFGNLIK